MPQKQRAAAVTRFQAGGSKAFVFTAGAGGVRESRRRGCYYADAPSPSRLKHLLKVEGGAQWSDRLVDGQVGITLTAAADIILVDRAL